jgi:hypothetical protein
MPKFHKAELAFILQYLRGFCGRKETASMALTRQVHKLTSIWSVALVKSEGSMCLSSPVPEMMTALSVNRLRDGIM